MLKNEIIDYDTFVECVMDYYYLIRCGAESQCSIDVLKTVYPLHYIKQASIAVFSFFNLMRVKHEIS